MSQHFLLTAKARSLSLATVARLSDEEAYQTFKLVRWAATDGQPVCPRCECVAVYTYATRKLFKCKACNHQFSVTSGTIFASRKLSIRDYLLAIAIFVNGAKGHSALQLSRDLDCQYKTAFVMAHKIREALASEANGTTVSGEVEVDGAYFGGHVRPSMLRNRLFGYPELPPHGEGHKIIVRLNR
jgi:transposase-like protein